MKSHILTAEFEGLRADVALKKLEPDLSRQEIKALFLQDEVLLGKGVAGKGEKVSAGQTLSFDYVKPWVKSESALEIEVIYTDDDLVVVNKPAGMPSHPLERGEGNTALDAVVALYPEVATASTFAREGGLVHRLDNDTSGLLMFARNQSAYDRLRMELNTNAIAKTYLALAHGRIEDDFEINAPIAHHAKNKKKMVAVADDKQRFRGEPKPALTQVVVLKTSDHISLIQVAIEGGRRHQIRVHLATVGFPLVGDKLYGGPTAHRLPGHALHAESITLPNGKVLKAPVPADFWGEAKEYGILNPQQSRLSKSA